MPRSSSLASLCAVASCATLILTACSSKDKPKGPAIEDLPPMLAGAVCEEFAHCTGDKFLKIALGGMDCETTLEAQIEDDTIAHIQASVDAKHTKYNGAKVDACLTAIGKLDCEITAQRLDAIDGCEDVFVGTVAVGEECDANEACEGDAYCKLDKGCPGKCTQRGKAGADCDRDDACRSGLHCGALGTCEKPASEGETCGGGSAPGCALGLSCQGEDAAKHITGKCVTLDTVLHAKVGESCDLAAGKLCAPDLSCAIKPNTIPVAFECMKKVASAAKCQYGIPSQCPDNEYCDADLAKLKTDGVCRKLPVSGEACLADMPGFPRCAPQLLCSTEEKCRKVGRLGDACGDDSECASTHCDKDKCAAETCK